MVKEFNEAGFQGVFGSDDFEAVVFDQVGQDGRVLTKLVGRRADVGSDCFSEEKVGVVIGIRREESFDCRFDAVDDVANVGGARLAGLLEFANGGLDCAAIGMTKHHHEASAKLLGRKLDGAKQSGVDNVTGHANDEQVAKILIKDEFDRCPGIRATEDDGEGALTFG